jgi:hypothetical protein
MHYPQCNGASYTLSFSQSDFDGAASVYGSPSGEGSSGESATPPQSSGTPHSASTSGDVSQGQEVQLSPLDVLGGSNLRVTMSGSGDADLYLRFDGQPTLQAFDCRPYLEGSSESCNLDVPANASQAYIMVHGYTAASYALQVQWESP